MVEPRKRVPDKVHAPEAIRERLASGLPGWSFADGCIQRTYTTSGWKATLMVVNTVGHLAEAAWHHPDLAVSYAAVTVKLSTHDAKGVTDKDFALARKIEDVVGWRPGQEEGSPLEGTPDDPRFSYIRHDAPAS